MKVVLVRRTDESQKKAYLMNYDATARGEKPSDDFQLANYDVLFVPKTGVADVETVVGPDGVTSFAALQTPCPRVAWLIWPISSSTCCTSTGSISRHCRCITWLFPGTEDG